METIKASLSNVSLSKEKNKCIISGCIAKVNEPSTGSPCGAGGYLISFTQEAVDSCGKTFEGMPVNCVLPDGWCEPSEAILSGHGNTIIGFMRKVKQKDDNIMAEIVLWKDRNPMLSEMIINAMDSLGFSVEMYPTKVHNDEKANIQYIDEFEGVGCAMLWSNAAAFSQTFIEKIAANRSDKMNEEIKNEIAEQIKAANDVHVENINKLTESLAEIRASLEGLVSLQESVDMLKAAQEEQKKFVEEMASAEIEPTDDVESIKAELAEIKASLARPVIPQPQTAPAVNPNVNDDGAGLKAEIEKINASDMNAMDKLRAIAKAKMKG